MLDTLLTTTGTKTRAYLLGATIRVRTNCGDGTVRYLTSDLYVGVQLDGDQLIEFHRDHLVEVAS